MVKSFSLTLGLVGLKSSHAAMQHMMNAADQAVDSMIESGQDLTILPEQVQNTINMKAFQPIIETYLAAVDNYGCWCHFGADHYKGKGPIINSIDGSCKTLTLGYECAILDAQAAGIECVPWEVDYISYNPFFPKETIPTQCADSNDGDLCAIWACTIEGHFTHRVFEDFLANVVYDPTYKHDGGFFDPAISCTLGMNGGAMSEKSCCGSYPYRFPYKTYGNERSCCGQKTYNVFAKCCEDEDDSLILAAGQCS